MIARKYTEIQISISARDARMFTCFEKIIQGQNEIKRMLQEIISSGSTSTTSTSEYSVPENISLPVTDFDELNETEIQLQDQSTYNKLVSIAFHTISIGAGDNNNSVITFDITLLTSMI